MATAKITLNENGPMTYHGQGYSIQRGQAIVTSKDEDILHFSAEPGFTVDMVKGEKPKAAVVVEEDEDEADADDSDDDDKDGEVTDGFTKKDLDKQTKDELLQLASENGIKADASMKKGDIVATILAAKKD
jgi:hypothetical protein